VLAGHPRGEGHHAPEGLTLAGRPLPPSLRTILAHDRGWLPVFASKRRHHRGERVSALAARAGSVLEHAIGGDRHLTAKAYAHFERLYPGACFLLEGPVLGDGDVSASFLYVGQANADGEYPVLVYWQPDDSPGQIVIEAPSLDVWLARRASLIKGTTGARGSGLPKEYAAALQAQADLNFAGCWAHEFSDIVDTHDPDGDAQTCSRMKGVPSRKPKPETLLMVWGASITDISAIVRAIAIKVHLFRGEARVRSGPFAHDTFTVVPAGSRPADPRAVVLMTATSLPGQRSFRFERTPSTNGEFAAEVLRGLSSLPHAIVEVGVPAPGMPWVINRSRKISTPKELSGWIDANLLPRGQVRRRAAP
jgi:hypothetical protein